MKTRNGLLIGAVLAIAMPAWSVEPASSPATAAQTRSGAEKPALNLRSPDVQKIIHAVAKEQIESAAPDTSSRSLDQPRITARGEQTSIPFRAPRRFHHMVCGSFDCVAYTADDVALYSIPRAQYYGINATGDNSGNEWLSCQSHDNLLTTFERYDKCRGVTIGLPPVAFGNTVIAMPGLTF